MSARPGAPQIILAFDYGTRRIGVASGDTLTGTARAITTLPGGNAAPWAQIATLVREYQPSQFVVGLPFNMDDTPTALTEVVREFAAELRARHDLPVALVDERLSSREAEGQLREARASGLKKRRTTHGDVDMIAARILLEQWLENPELGEVG